MSDIYKEIIIDHYKNPRNFGPLEVFTHHAILENTSCGDRLELWLLVDENNTIKDLKFSGEGCVISIAMMSMVGEEVIGMKVSELSNYSSNKITESLNLRLSMTRKKCASLSAETLKGALSSGK